MANDGAIIAAALTGTAGCITAYAAVVRAKHHGAKECEEKLAAERATSERLATELHDERMNRELGAIDWLLLLAIALFTTAAVFGAFALASRVAERGPPGPPGPKGVHGAPGPSGSTGANGTPGATGVQGPKGASGPSGTPGQSAGSTGASGPSGATGTSGASGARGPAGLTGPPGPAGPAGTPGRQGPPGSSSTMTCPSGSTLRHLTVNARGGQTTIVACVVG